MDIIGGGASYDEFRKVVEVGNVDLDTIQLIGEQEAPVAKFLFLDCDGVIFD